MLKRLMVVTFNMLLQILSDLFSVYFRSTGKSDHVYDLCDTLFRAVVTYLLPITSYASPLFHYS